MYLSSLLVTKYTHLPGTLRYCVIITDAWHCLRKQALSETRLDAFLTRVGRKSKIEFQIRSELDASHDTYGADCAEYAVGQGVSIFFFNATWTLGILGLRLTPRCLNIFPFVVVP
jgi:hypothetical protein